jgi:hypothetical protein
MKAYVYTHTRLDTNEIFYVGIGLQDNYKRASFRYSRTKHWNNIVKKCGWKVDIVADKLTWEDACKKEIELIKKYGRVDLGTGTLVNLTDGGEGPLNRITTPETRAKMSKTRKGAKCTDEHKEKTRLSMLGKNKKKIVNVLTEARQPPYCIALVSGCPSSQIKIKMEYIDDLSFSNLVNLIQGEEIKAADILHTIALEMEDNNKVIEELESQLSRAKGRKDTLISGTQRVMQHIKKEYPLAVKRQDYIVVVTKENISIERNVL